MDAQLTVENIPFIWGIAFLVNVIIGVVMFAMIVRKTLPVWASGVSCWIGWWAWASALSLVINFTAGASNPFSYHQVGVLTESMVNIGLIFWTAVYVSKNWYICGDDWLEIERLRTELTIRALNKSLEAKNESE